MGSAEALRELFAAPLASAGFELWDVELTRDVVRVVVDRPGGVDLEGVARASGVVSPLLDRRPELAPTGRYQLEVSSPGAERTLRTVDQRRRYVGWDVSVKTVGPLAGSRRHRGRIAGVDENTVSLDMAEPAGVGRLVLRHDEIERMRTVLVWAPAERGRVRSQASRRRVGTHRSGGGSGARARGDGAHGDGAHADGAHAEGEQSEGRHRGHSTGDAATRAAQGGTS